MFLAALAGAALLGQPPLAIPPAPSKDVETARSDLGRCLSVQAARIERLEENLESVGRLATLECYPQVATYVHAQHVPTVTEFAEQMSAFTSRMQVQTEAMLSGQAHSSEPGRVPDFNASRTLSITQELINEASRDAIAAREARLFAHKN